MASNYGAGFTISLSDDMDASSAVSISCPDILPGWLARPAAPQILPRPKALWSISSCASIAGLEALVSW